MSNFRYISEDQKKLIVIMSACMRNKDIAAVTGISERAIRRVIKLWKETGKVIQRPLETGRPRSLTSLEITVSLLFSIFRGSQIMIVLYIVLGEPYRAATRYLCT
jgi:hypothetical protein